MKAMVFAAGLGTRLKPLTDDKPKALVEVAGVPMLERVICKLVNAGISDIVVNVHHFSTQVVNFIAGKDNFGVNITISDESKLLLDTGGGILAARQWLQGDEPILVHNTDILADFDIKEMEAAHAKSGALATLLVKERSTARYLIMDPAQEMEMRGWTNISTGETKPSSLDWKDTGLGLYAFGGVHIISPEIFPLLKAYADEIATPVFSIIPFYINACQTRKICGYMPAAPYRWHDIGKLDSLAAASADFQ